MALAAQAHPELSVELRDDEGKLFRYSNYKDDIYLEKYEIIRRTPKGCWILDTNSRNGERFILDNCRRSFAHPTREKALKSFKHRKWAQLRIIEDQQRNALGALNTVPDLEFAIEDFNIRVNDYKLEQINKLLCPQK